MSSIALFYSIFTEEKETREQLAAASGFAVIQDADIINEVCQQHAISKDKVERALYGSTSVFNKFTLERERITALLKAAMAEHLKTSGVVYSGSISLLLSPEVTHVLRVGLFDNTNSRIKRSMGEGLTEKNGVKLIKKNDAGAAHLAEFLYKKEANDISLYDIVLQAGAGNPESNTA